MSEGLSGSSARSLGSPKSPVSRWLAHLLVEAFDIAIRIGALRDLG